MKNIPVEIKVNSTDRHDTAYYDVTVKIGEEEFQVQGDDRSGWDDEGIVDVEDCLADLGSDLTFEDLMDLYHGGKGETFEISVGE